MSGPTLVVSEHQTIVAIETPPEPQVIAIREGLVGPAGATGPTGATGPPGPPGGSGYVHDQLAPATTWAIVHNLGRYPSVTVVDSGDTTVVGNVAYLDVNRVTLTFSAAFGGRAFLN